MIKAILTKPLDGHPEGAEREFDGPDFEALRAMGAVRAAAITTPVAAPAPSSDDDALKAAPAPRNKKAPAVENKA